MYIKLYNKPSYGIATPYRFKIVDELSNDDYLFSGYGGWGVHSLDETSIDGNCYLIILDLDDYVSTLEGSCPGNTPVWLQDLIDYIEEALSDYMLGKFLTKLN